MKKPHIFISYANTGAGHKTPALAIAERIEELYPNQFDITTSNFFEDAGAHEFNNYIENSWDFLLQYPTLTKFIQFVGKILFLLAPHYIRVCQRKVWKKSLNYLAKVNPDVVFSTHFFSYTMAIDARKKMKLNYTIVGLNPDTFDTFPQWDPRGDLLLVCSELARKKALLLGHSSKKLKIVPQVLRREFITKNNINKKELFQEYGLQSDTFTIFMSDGGQGFGKLYSSITRLIRMNQPLNIIAVCGKNQKLYQRLRFYKRKLERENHPVRIFPFAFVESIVPFINMSDLFIGKSGPATIWECLKLNLPVMINFSANDAERKTARFFVKQHVAISCKNQLLLPRRVKKIIKNPSILEKMRKNINQLDIFDDGSTAVAQVIVSQHLKYQKQINQKHTNLC